jgi:hypothetical protein
MCHKRTQEVCTYVTVTNLAMVLIFEMCGKFDVGKRDLVLVEIMHETASVNCIIINLKLLVVLPYRLWHTYKAGLFKFTQELLVPFLQRGLGYVHSFSP